MNEGQDAAEKENLSPGAMQVPGPKGKERVSFNGINDKRFHKAMEENQKLIDRKKSGTLTIEKMFEKSRSRED